MRRGRVKSESVMSEASLKRLLEMSSSVSFSSEDMSFGRVVSRLPLRERLSRFSNLASIGIIS